MLKTHLELWDISKEKKSERLKERGGFTPLRTFVLKRTRVYARFAFSSLYGAYRGSQHYKRIWTYPQDMREGEKPLCYIVNFKMKCKSGTKYPPDKEVL